MKASSENENRPVVNGALVVETLISICHRQTSQFKARYPFQRECLLDDRGEWLLQPEEASFYRTSAQEREREGGGLPMTGHQETLHYPLSGASLPGGVFVRRPVSGFHSRDASVCVFHGF